MSLVISIFQKFYNPRHVLACVAGALLLPVSVPAQDASKTAKKPVLIIDTNIAEGKNLESEQIREPDAAKSKENLDIGNMYLKRRNYAAAISRFVEAIAWQENSIPSHEALARAYEKNGDITKSMQTLEAVIEKNPDSPKNKGFQSRIDALRKKLQ